MGNVGRGVRVGKNPGGKGGRDPPPEHGKYKPSCLLFNPLLSSKNLFSYNKNIKRRSKETQGIEMDANLWIDG